MSQSNQVNTSSKFMKKSKPQHERRIVWQEACPQGVVVKSFTCYTEHVQWHLQQMQKSPAILDVKVERA